MDFFFQNNERKELLGQKQQSEYNLSLNNLCFFWAVLKKIQKLFKNVKYFKVLTVEPKKVTCTLDIIQVIMLPIEIIVQYLFIGI